jgi:phenylpropionate dioxygenase-like ring-hydroxylating dioxygenase large terminal subunit
LPDTQPAPARTGITREGHLTDSWYLAAPSARLKAGKQERFLILGEPVVLGRTPAGEAFALRDICPHRLVPLSAGAQIETDGEWTLQCPYHGWRFGTDGGCRLMPSLTEDSAQASARVSVRRYPLHEANGAVWLYVVHDPRSAAPPAALHASFDPLPDKPGFAAEAVLYAAFDIAVGRLTAGDTPFAPHDRGWTTGPQTHPPGDAMLRWRLGGEVKVETAFQLPGQHWQVFTGAAARLVMLTTLIPETADKTRLTCLVWWTGAPLLRFAAPRLARQALAQAASAAKAPGDTDVYLALKHEWAAARTEGRDFVNPMAPRTATRVD